MVTWCPTGWETVPTTMTGSVAPRPGLSQSVIREGRPGRRCVWWSKWMCSVRDLGTMKKEWWTRRKTQTCGQVIVWDECGGGAGRRRTRGWRDQPGRIDGIASSHDTEKLADRQADVRWRTVTTVGHRSSHWGGISELNHHNWWWWMSTPSVYPRSLSNKKDLQRLMELTCLKNELRRSGDCTN